MKKWLIALAMAGWWLGLFAGCAGVSKETAVKCPKCGTLFTIHEGPRYGGRN